MEPASSHRSRSEQPSRGEDGGDTASGRRFRSCSNSVPSRGVGMSSAGSCSGFILSPFGKPQCGYRNGSTRHLPLPWPQRHNVVQSEEALVQPLSLSAGTGWFTTLRSAATASEGLGAPAGAVMWAGPGAGSGKAGRGCGSWRHHSNPAIIRSDATCAPGHSSFL